MLTRPWLRLAVRIAALLAAVAFDWVSARLGVVKRHYRGIQIAAGILLVAFGVLMMFGVLDQMSRWLPAFSPGGL